MSVGPYQKGERWGYRVRWREGGKIKSKFFGQTVNEDWRTTKARAEGFNQLRKKGG